MAELLVDLFGDSAAQNVISGVVEGTTELTITADELAVTVPVEVTE